MSAKQAVKKLVVHFNQTSRSCITDVPSELSYTLTTSKAGELHPEFEDGIDNLIASIRQAYERLQEVIDSPTILMRIRRNKSRTHPKAKKTYIAFRFIDECEGLLAELSFHLEVNRQLNEDQLRRLAKKHFSKVRRKFKRMVHFEERCHHQAELFCLTTRRDLQARAVRDFDSLVATSAEVDETTYERLDPGVFRIEEPVGLLRTA